MTKNEHKAVKCWKCGSGVFFDETFSRIRCLNCGTIFKREIGEIAAQPGGLQFIRARKNQGVV